MPGESTADRVTRMLAMLGYLAENDGVPVGDLAAHFGVSESQVLKDIDILWVTGTPGYYPDDLIDFSVDDWEDRIISLRDARGLNRPVPLAPREALALAAAVAWLRRAGVADPAMQAVLASVQAKLGGSVEVADAGDGADSGTRAGLLAAIEAGDAVEIDYVSAEDRRTTRVIEPQGLYTDGASWYVEAWCHLAGERRTFRVDRILGMRAAVSREGGERPAHQEQEPTEAVLVLDPGARWLAEELPGTTVQEVVHDGAPAIEVRLTISRTDWLVRRLLSLGPQVRAVGPPELRRSLADRAGAAVAAYGT